MPRVEPLSSRRAPDRAMASYYLACGSRPPPPWKRMRPRAGYLLMTKVSFAPWPGTTTIAVLAILRTYVVQFLRYCRFPGARLPSSPAAHHARAVDGRGDGRRIADADPCP